MVIYLKISAKQIKWCLWEFIWRLIWFAKWGYKVKKWSKQHRRSIYPVFKYTKWFLNGRSKKLIFFFNKTMWNSWKCIYKIGMDETCFVNGVLINFVIETFHFGDPNDQKISYAPLNLSHWVVSYKYRSQCLWSLR